MKDSRRLSLLKSTSLPHVAWTTRVSLTPGTMLPHVRARESRSCAAVPVFASDALEATKIAAALTESFRRGKPIFFDDEGEAILD